MGNNSNFKKAWSEIKAKSIGDSEQEAESVEIIGDSQDDEQSVTSSFVSPTTLIAKGTKIEGSITTTGPLQIDGEIKGNILKTEYVTVTGTVTGDIVCNTLRANGAKITGEVAASNKIEISNNGVIIGNVNTSSMTLLGSVQGNIIAKENVEILATSKVTGDIAASTISIEKGAIIDGRLSIQPTGTKKAE